MTTLTVATRLANLKATVPTQVSTRKLLEVVILLCLTESKSSLHAALYAWVIAYPFYDVQELTLPETPQLAFYREQLLITPRMHSRLLDIAHAVYTYLKFGDYYGSEHWYEPAAINRDLLLEITYDCFVKRAHACSQATAIAGKDFVTNFWS